MQISNFTENKEDLLKKAVIHLVNVMASDFGDRFKQAFKDDEQITQLKRRLYGNLKGLHIADIYDGYELLFDKKPSFVPTVPEIVESVLYCQKRRLDDEKNQTEAERIGLMPPKQEISEKAFPLHGKSLMAKDHQCHVGWCDRYGTLSNSITGNGNWYCAEHFGKNGL